MRMNRLALPFSAISLPTGLCCAYLFFSHLPGTAAMVNVLLGLMLIALIVLSMRREIVLNTASPLLRAFAAFVVVALLGIAASPYWQESLIPLRREVLPMGLVLILLAGQRSTRQNPEAVIRWVIWAITLAFACRTVLAFHDWWGQGLNNDVYSIDRAHARYFNFFAIDACIMLPVCVAAALYLPMRAWARCALGGIIALAFVLIVASGVRAALVTTALVTLLQLAPLLWRYKWRSLVLVVLTGAVAATLFAPRLEKLGERYGTVLSADTYEEKAEHYSSFYERLSIWNGTLQLVAERPLLGYGLGFQKIYDVVHNDGYFTRWQTSDKQIERAVAHYFEPLAKGQANPHNVIIDILFETGILGLVAYAAMLLILLARAWRTFRQKTSDATTRCFAAGSLAYLLSYALITTMNGLWLTAGASLMLLAASEILWQQRAHHA